LHINIPAGIHPKRCESSRTAAEIKLIPRVLYPEDFKKLQRSAGILSHGLSGVSDNFLGRQG
jgi:hypothetical protein